MKTYRHILLAVDLTDDSEAVGARACELARRFDARLSLLHVVEYLPVDPAGEALLPPPVNIEQDLVESARRRLDELAEKLGIAASDRIIETGNIKHEIVRVATERAADLIVLGSREKHGLAVLLGSTEKAILSAAPCDVLAVRLS
ncbi:MAG TPA: universal stress protein [Gammaproteobacteria bacterium]|nr:universal stress protein [Gammaproteobacteria bacterium]